MSQQQFNGIGAASIPSGHEDQRGARMSRTIAVGSAAVAVAFLATYFPVLRILTHQWRTNDTYSFGVLVPVIAGYLVWSRRASLALLLPEPHFLGGISAIVVAASLFVLGRSTGIIGLQEVSLVSMVIALVLLLCGPKFVKQIWFPLVYLFLMLPIWEVFSDPLHRPAQLLSAQVAAILLEFVGIPVRREGIWLDLPNIKLEIASACSGVNFLVAVIAVGVPQAYQYLRGVLPRGLVIIFALMVALLGNGLRVAIIGFLSYRGISATIHGPGHLLQGLFVSSIGFVALFAAVHVMARRYPRRRLRAPEHSPSTAPRMGRSGFAVAAVCATALLFITGMVHLSVGSLTRPAPIYVAPAIDGWTSTGQAPVRFMVGGDAQGSIGRSFLVDGRHVDLFVGDLAFQDGAGAIAYRSVTLPTNVVPSVIPIAGADREVQVNQARFDDGQRTTEVTFWYDLGGRTTPHRTTAKAYALIHLLTRRGGAPRLVIVVTEKAPSAVESNTAVIQRLLNRTAG